MMDELSMRVRRGIAHMAREYEWSIRDCASWLMSCKPGMRKDFIGMEEVVHRDLNRTIENVLTLFIIGEESEMKFDAAKYTELANSGMSNVRIAKEMGYNSDAGMRYHAVRAGVYQSDPSGSQAKKADDKPNLSPAEKELVKQLANANVGKVEGGGFKPMTTIAKDTANVRQALTSLEVAIDLPAELPDKIDITATSDDRIEKTGKDLGGKLTLESMLSVADADIVVTVPDDKFITIRIPITPDAKYDQYVDRHVRESNIKHAVNSLRSIALSIHDDITDLLGEEDIERVQAYIDRHIG